jgi:peptide/nickel transport system substrate-binding protein
VVPNHVRSWAPLFGRWFQTGGRTGREPTEPARRIVELYEQGKAVPEQERYALGQELLKIYADQAYVIGTVGVSPSLMGVWVVSNDLGNVPESVPFSTPAQTPGHALPEQFFFK